MPDDTSSSLESDQALHDALRGRADEESRSNLFKGWIGDSFKPYQIPNVTLTIKQSTEKVTAGDPWSVIANLKNNSQQTVWIVDTTTSLFLPTEVNGRYNGKLGSISAFFPTIKSVNHDEVVRIEPGSSYFFSWRVRMGRDEIKSAPGEEHGGVFDSLSSSIHNAASNYLFFSPGNYAITATVQIWIKPPEHDSIGNVINIGHSFPISESIDVLVDSSQFVLIIGAILGGMICYVLQVIYGKIPIGVKWNAARLLKILAGLCAAALFPAVMTILLSRIASTDFILAIKVKDIWGAFATGFVVQWIGQDLLSKLISKIDDKSINNTTSDTRTDPTSAGSPPNPEIASTQFDTSSPLSHAGPPPTSST